MKRFSCFLLYLIFLYVNKITCMNHVKKRSMTSRSHFIKLNDRVDPNELHEVIFSIKHNNLDKLEELVLSRSTPGNENYLKWLTYDELGDMITNHISHDYVEKKLLEYNHNIIGEKKIQITFKSNHKEFIRAKAPVYIWERILNTKFYYFNDLHQHTNNKEYVYKHIRSLEYSLPSELFDHVDVVFNTVQIPSPLNKKYNGKKVNKDEEEKIRKLIIKDSKLLRGNDNIRRSLVTYKGYVDVDFLKSFYGIPATEGSSSMKQAIFETNDQHWSPKDLIQFQKLNHLPKDIVLEVGDDKKTDKCGSVDPKIIVCDEGNLDVQFIMGAAQNVKTVYWYVCVTDDHTACGGGDVFLQYAIEIGNDRNPATSSSISWGAPENLVETEHIRAFDIASLKLASIGVTTMVSSGDDGVMGALKQQGSSSECSCFAPSGYDTLTDSNKWDPITYGTWSGKGYFPSFPATSPWVVSVGGTQGPENNKPEIACESIAGGVITTGGGFSVSTTAPIWQKRSVDNYFDNLRSSRIPADGYNKKGRAYPDFSMIAVWYQGIMSGREQAFFGTSASAPVVASMVSIVNSLRELKNLSTIGFINPTLYNNPDLFNDIIAGRNNCCHGQTHSDIYCCDAGFHTDVGWDPVTGLGSIDFDKFASMFNVSTKHPIVESDSMLTRGEMLFAGVVITVALSLLIVVFWTCCNMVFQKDDDYYY